MISRRLGWAIGVLALSAIMIFLGWPREPKLDTDDEKQPPIQRKAPVIRTSAGDLVLVLDAPAQARAGIRTAPLESTKLQPQIEAYGRLQEDPAESFDLRAPAGGMLQIAGGRPWPKIGDAIADGTAVGVVQLAVTPMDRLGISERLISARADEKSAISSTDGARASWERIRMLNADNRNASDRALQEAEVRLRTEEARLKAARDAVRLFESSLEVSGGVERTRELVALRGGEVTEVLAQPGEAIESGQLLLRLRRYDRLIARIYLPSGHNLSPPPTSAHIIPVGLESESLLGRRVGTATAVDPESQAQPLLFGISVPQKNLRPGLAVVAHLPVAGQATTGVVIPASAVVRFAGKAWIYLRSGEDKFVRKEVRLDYPVERGWFSTAGFVAGDQAVVEGAQLLLSEELKSQIQVGEENPA